MKRAAVFDRDGTLIDVVRDEETGTITTAFHPSQLRLLPGAIDGLHMLRDAGFVFAIATNQPGPAKGMFSIEAVHRTNSALVELLAKENVRIAKVAACLHHPVGAPYGETSLVGPCDCRKPKPGMLTTLASELGFAPERSWMVGDHEGDIEAGAAAGMRTALVFPANRCELCPLRTGFARAGTRASPDVHGATLADIAKAIIAA